MNNSLCDWIAEALFCNRVRCQPVSRLESQDGSTVLRIVVTPNNGTAAISLAAKTHSGGRGQHADRTRLHLIKALTDQDSDQLRLPARWGYCEPLDATVEAWLTGDSMITLICTPDAKRQAAAAGQSLATLHSLKPPSGDQWEITSPWWQCRPSPHALDGALFGGHDRLAELVGRVQERGTNVMSGRGSVLLHGDFQPSQLLRTDSGLFLLDWEWSRCGHRGYDVSSFIAYLETHCDARTAAVLGQIFVDSYLEHAGVELVELDLQPLLALHAIRRACRRVRLADRGWRAEATSMLSRAEAMLTRKDLVGDFQCALSA